MGVTFASDVELVTWYGGTLPEGAPFVGRGFTFALGAAPYEDGRAAAGGAAAGGGVLTLTGLAVFLDNQ